METHLDVQSQIQIESYQSLSTPPRRNLRRPRRVSSSWLEEELELKLKRTTRNATGQRGNDRRRVPRRVDLLTLGLSSRFERHAIHSGD